MASITASPDPERLCKSLSIMNEPIYRDCIESATAFNRKLNEERCMRIPYIDNQTGVAMKHYNSIRNKRERMPPRRQGQVYSYPQKIWRKSRYQYLRYYLQPTKHFEVLADTSYGCEPTTTIEVPAVDMCAPTDEIHGETETPVTFVNTTSVDDATKYEDDNYNNKNANDWSYYEDDVFPEGADEDANSDSDFEYDDSYVHKRKYKTKNGLPGTPASYKTKNKSGLKGLDGSSKRRTHADSIPDSEKPFCCELCGVRYKTRPGLSYHYKNSHKDTDHPPVPTTSLAHQQHLMRKQQQLAAAALNDSLSSNAGGRSPSLEGRACSPALPSVAVDSHQLSSATGGETENDTLTQEKQVRLPSHRRSAAIGVSYGESVVDVEESESKVYDETLTSTSTTSAATAASMTTVTCDPNENTLNPNVKKTLHGHDRAPSLGYCDFCLGTATNNKKTGQAEQLVACAECGRSGHPTCLQFTENMIISVKQYPWQCIECKCCTLCGTSENDDQLLFCDDCDRGYHMYCLSPPIKEPPEGSWSCQLCIDTFHRKKQAE